MGSKQEFPFGISVEKLMAMVDPKDPTSLSSIGGTSGLLKALCSDKHIGPLEDQADIETRRAFFGTNRIPFVPQRSFLLLVWDVLHDKTLIMLMIASIVSLTIGIYKDLSTQSEMNNHGYSWLEGLAIIIAIFIVVLVSALNDYQKESQFRKLNAKKEDRNVNILRQGKEQSKSIHDLVVGDIILVEPGDVIAADGVVLDAYNLSCDESGATGESDAIRKSSLELSADPFMLSGTKVIEGVGQFVVIAVGIYSYNGKLLLSLQTEKEDTPLQLKLNVLAEKIAKLGAAMALTMLLALSIKFLITESLKPNGFGSSLEIVDGLLNIFIQAVTILVVAVPEGLPMAVTIALAYATGNMIKDNNLVRILAACETMGNATTICSDKTGTLTTNIMTVVKARFAGLDYLGTGGLNMFPEAIVNLLNQSIVLNSTAFETEQEGKTIFIGNKTEVALLNLIKPFPINKTREQTECVSRMPFSSVRKSMSVIVKIGGKYRYYVKGASEVILSHCTHEIDAAGNVSIMESKEPYLKYIQKMANEALRTIALAYVDLDHCDVLLDGSFPSSLNLLGIVGIQDPVRPGVPEAVLQCQKAGIFVRMVTGDNISTACAIARQCHILMRGGIAMEGPKFRQLTDAQLTDIVPKLQVLARSSPLDKQILVHKLKSMNEVVAVTGDGTNDGPALKAADVGFSMGITGTEVAKEASSIILMDDNFTSIVKAVLWGRCVHDSVRKFLQFQLTVNVTAVIVAFVSAMMDDKNTSVLSAVQLLWVNLIMDTLAALALATDKPSPELLDRKPESKFAPLVNRSMIKMILGQSLFQIALSLVLLHLGPAILRLDPTFDYLLLKTTVFNVFVMCQLFNEVNCRILGDSQLNPFSGLFRNSIFMGVLITTIIGQVVIVSFGGTAFSTVALPWSLWLITIGLGALSLPIGLICRLIPIPEISSNHLQDLEKGDRIVMTKERLQWQAAITDIRHGLSVFSALRRSQEPYQSRGSLSFE